MVREIIGNALLLLSVIFIFIGLFGVFRFKDFYSKLLASSKIDTAATITLILGASIRSGLTWFTLKALLIMIFIFFISPIVTSKIARSAREDELFQLEGRRKVSSRKKGRRRHGN